MPFLTAADIDANFRRNKPMQQFRGRTPGSADAVRWLELRPKFNGVELWVFEVDDVGTADHTDVQNFPPLNGSLPSFPVAVLADGKAALDYAAKQFSAAGNCWREPGHMAEEYADFVRARRPDVWVPDGA